MKKIEVISINGGEIHDSDVDDELQSIDVSTHYADSIFRVSKENMPHMHAFLVKNKMIKETDALTWSDQVTCCMWGT